jgi:hypothetical protein
MKRFVPFSITFCLFLTVMASCWKTGDSDAAAQEADDKTHYGSNLTALPTLSDAAKLQAISWSVFEDFEVNTQRLKNKTIPVLQGIAEQLTLQTDSLLTKIPDTINTRPIYERLILVNTRAKLLEQLAKENNVDSLVLETGLKEMNMAAGNLFIEMNRTFKKSKIDDELKETEKKELEKQNKFLDSVYKAEIQDNKGN